MKWNTKFNYPKSSRSNEDGMRKYLSGDEKYPSVTSVLSLTKSEEDKASLELWKQRVGYKEANRIKTDASRRGTSLHSYIEDYLRGRVNDSFFESNEQHKNMAKVIIENGIKGKLEEIYGMEATLINPNDKYAGTADLIGIYKGNETIIDFKQSNRPKREEWIEDYFYQLCAYIMAHELMYGKIEQGVVLVCTVDLVFQKFILSGDRLEILKKKWLEKVEHFHALQSFGERTKEIS